MASSAEWAMPAACISARLKRGGANLIVRYHNPAPAVQIRHPFAVVILELHVVDMAARHPFLDHERARSRPSLPLSSPSLPIASNAVGDTGIPAVMPKLVMMGANTSEVVMATVSLSTASTWLNRLDSRARHRAVVLVKNELQAELHGVRR